MKNKSSKKTIWQSTLSIAVFFLFIFLGLGSNSLFDLIGVPITTETVYSIETNTYTQKATGNTEWYTDSIWYVTIKGKKDSYGKWRGDIVLRHFYKRVGPNGYIQRTSKEDVYYKDGRRDGMSITSYHSILVYDSGKEIIEKQRKDTVCYNYGNIIPCSELKSASITEGNPTAFQILKDNYTWFLTSLNVLGFENEYVKSYMDTVEVLLNTESFDFTMFDSNYDDVIEQLEETAYDSLVQINKMVTSVYGLELMKDLDFRMAVIDQQRDKNKTSFQFLQNSYPHFLTSFNTEETIVKDSEWESFCSKFDSLMNTLSPLDISDPFFVDSVDTRIFSVLNTIYEEESDTTKSAIKQSALKQAISNRRNLCLPCLLKEHDKPLLRQQTADITPQAFALAIMIRMYRIFLYEGDIPRLAIKEAYTNQQNIATLASVTTQLNGEISENEFELLGNVVKDGGGEIIERGMVWAKYNNPTVDDNKILAGQGIGGFTSSLQINDDSVYYVRAFATNSAGTAYGNSIILNGSNLVGLDNFESGNFKFIIYPNPVSSAINLDFDTNKWENLSFEIIDLTGRIVLQKQLDEVHIGKNHFRFNISSLKNGLYICVIKNNREQLFSQKLNVTH